MAQDPQIQAVGIDISAVGRGIAFLDASGFTEQPGRFSVNGGPFLPLPGTSTRYSLGQPVAATLGPVSLGK